MEHVLLSECVPCGEQPFGMHQHRRSAIPTARIGVSGGDVQFHAGPKADLRRLPKADARLAFRASLVTQRAIDDCRESLVRWLTSTQLQATIMLYSRRLKLAMKERLNQSLR